MKKVTSQDVLAVIDLTRRIQAIRYIPAKKEELARAIELMEPSAKWLLTFCCWHCLFNSSFKSMAEDRIPVMQEKENVATFLDFLMLLRRYENIRISPSREGSVMKFLASCDRLHREFYSSLLTKTWLSAFPVLDMQTLLELDQVTKETVYGEIEYLKSGFGTLSFPIAMRTVPAGKLIPFTLVKGPAQSSFMTKEGDSFKPSARPDWVNLDLKLSTTPQYALAGFIGINRMYPTDYFPNWMTGVAYLSGEPVVSYEKRIALLNDFLDRSMLVNTVSTRLVVATDAEDFRGKLLPVLRAGTHTDILITDANSAKTGTAYRLECNAAYGIISDIWAVDGEAKGFSIWFNGSELKCPYKFEGKEQGMLAAVDAVKGRILKFYMVELGKSTLYMGSEVDWHQPRWRTMKLRGSDMWIEKCVLCGDTRSRHVNHGICNSCECNLPYYFKKYGPDIWITPSVQMTRKRRYTSWSCDLLNAVNYKHKGTVLQSDAEGRWMFKNKEE